MTEKSYLWTNDVTSPARVISKIEADVPIVRLDRTLFHPHSGNQRADRGRIDSAHVLGVHSLDQSIEHYVDTLDGISVGQIVTQQVDIGWRRLQSAYHTAGHLIAYAMMQVKPSSRILHNQHWPDKPKILLSVMERLNEEDLERLENALRDFIVADIPIVVEMLDNYRVVTIGNLEPFRCDGTHLGSTGEIKRVGITLCRHEGATAMISYATYLNNPET